MTQSSVRPTTTEELDIVLEKIFTVESRQKGMAFQPRATDVIISPYAKSGTTWLQQIAHGLRTRGGMDFEEITEVTPWLEIAHTIGWELNAPQVAQPRVYKSHLSWHDIPKGARYICSIRDPRDVMISFYRFFEGWFFEQGSIDMETLTRWRCTREDASTKGYWHHLASWWEQRNNPGVLLLCFEEMKEDLPGTIRAVAKFMGITLDDELLEIVTRQSSRQFMLANAYHFDEKFSRQMAHDLAGLPIRSDANKVTGGATDHPRYQFSGALRREFEIIWQEQIEAKFGFKNYGELRQALKQNNHLI